MKIDAHVHFWNYDPVRDSWMNGMDVLQKNYAPEALLPMLTHAGMDGCVAVQAEQSENETLYLLSLAQNNQEVKAVVGWVDLLDRNLHDRLSYFSQFPVVKGFRHIVQDEQDGFLLRKDFLNGIKTLAKYDFTYDVLVYPHQLEDAIAMMRQFPEQLFVIDHCAKPDIKNKDITAWTKSIQKAASLPNVHCKLSGLLTETNWKQWKSEDFYPYLEAVFNAFGTSRILYGSDWPVLLLSGEYLEWKELLLTYMTNFSAAEKELVFGINACKFYEI